MSKAVIAAGNMESGGRHWTKAEIEARQAAANELTRDTALILRCPTWLSAEARKVWNRVKKQAAAFNLLDELDIDMLAIYCDVVAKYQETRDPTWARLASSYADKLGLTPSARAKLAQKRAVEVVDEFGEEFDS
jgi:phage terminase small subunit